MKVLWILVFLFSYSSQSCFVEGFNPACQTTTYPATGSCYWYNQTAVSWKDALSACEADNGTLVWVDSIEVKYFLGAQASLSIKDDTWIGVSDGFAEGVFRWTDTRVVTWSDWDVSIAQPDGQASENCGALPFSHNTLGHISRWRDRDCSLRHHFICQSKSETQCDDPKECLVPDSSTWSYIPYCTSQTPDVVYYQVALLETCKKRCAQRVDFFCKTFEHDSYSGICKLYNSPPPLVAICQPTTDTFARTLPEREHDVVFWMSDESGPQSNGHAACAINNGRLATVRSTQDETMIASVITEDAWIDLSDEAVQGNFMFSDGSYPMWTKWAPGEPATFQLKRCVYMDRLSREWLVSLCSGDRVYICEQEIPHRQMTRADFWESSSQGRHSEGAAICGARGGRPAIIRTPEENDLVINITKTDEAWIGLTDERIEGTFEFIDGTRLTWMNWHPSEPNNGGGGNNPSDNCVFIFGGVRYRWVDDPCDKRRPFICERKEAPCQTAKSEHSGACYWLREESMTWPDALADCEGAGGTLAWVDTPETRDFLEQFIIPNITQNTWIGLSDGMAEGVFRWTSSRVATWSQWHATQPDNMEYANCVGYMTKGSRIYKGWFDMDCSAQQHFICQSHVEPNCTDEKECLFLHDSLWEEITGVCDDITPNVTYSDVANFSECTRMCVRRIDFMCTDVVYDPTTLRCQLFNEIQARTTSCTFTHVISGHRHFSVRNVTFFPTEQSTSFKNASKLCADRGGSLATVRNGEEAKQIDGLGLNGGVWLGLTEIDVPGVFKFTDGTYPTWTDWENGTAPGPASRNYCVRRLPNGKWNDRSCNNVSRQGLCEIGSIDGSTTSEATRIHFTDVIDVTTEVTERDFTTVTAEETSGATSSDATVTTAMSLILSSIDSTTDEITLTAATGVTTGAGTGPDLSTSDTLLDSRVSTRTSLEVTTAVSGTSSDRTTPKRVTSPETALASNEATDDVALYSMTAVTDTSSDVGPPQTSQGTGISKAATTFVPQTKHSEESKTTAAQTQTTSITEVPNETPSLRELFRYRYAGIKLEGGSKKVKEAPGAAGIGMVFITFLVMEIAFFLILDIDTILTQGKYAIRNIRGKCC